MRHLSSREGTVVKDKKLHMIGHGHLDPVALAVAGGFPRS